MADEQTQEQEPVSLLSPTAPEDDESEAEESEATAEPEAESSEEQQASWRDGIPEKFLKDTPEATLALMNQSYSNLEKTIATKVGKPPDSYEPPVNEKGDPIVDVENPAFKSTAEQAKKLGLTQEQFKGVTEAYLRAVEQGSLESHKETLAALGTEAPQRIAKLEKYLSKFGKETYEALAPTINTAAAVQAMEKLMKASGAPEPLAGDAVESKPRFSSMDEIRSHVKKVYPINTQKRDLLEKELIAKHFNAIDDNMEITATETGAELYRFDIGD